jgi:hypothetical protein
MRACVAQLDQLTKGYWTRRVLNNKLINFPQAKLAYKVLVFLSRKQLYEAVSRHVSSRLLLNCDCSRVYLLAKQYLVDINIAKLCLDAISLASAESRVVHKDTCRSGRAERSAPREARGTIASHDDGRATSLTYAVACWAC